MMSRGGKREGSGRTRTAIITAVRFNIVCPHCEEGTLRDVTAVKNQHLICSVCGQTSVIPTSARVQVGQKEQLELLTLEGIKESKPTIEKTETIKAVTKGTVEKSETIKLDLELAIKVLKRTGNRIRRMRRNHPNYNPDWLYLNNSLTDKTHLIEIAEKMIQTDRDQYDFEKIIYKARLRGLR